MTKRINDLNTADNRRMFDLLFRHQVYLEGVKSWFAGEYKQMLNALYGEFARYLARNRYATVDQFTKAELETFIYLFTRAQAQFYSRYTKDLIKLLKQFLADDLNIQKEILQDVTAKTTTQANLVLQPQLTEQEYAGLSDVYKRDYVRTTVDDSDASQRAKAIYTLTDDYQANQNASGVYGVGIVAGTKESNQRLWATITNQPIPANGGLLLAMISAYGTNTNAALTAIIRRGYANAWTKPQLQEALLGVGDDYKGGLFKTLGDKYTTLLATGLQHISSEVQSAVSSIYYERYQWVSVMDAVTTAICIARNGVVYVFGEGPLPPALWNCRAKIVPVANDTTLHDIPKSFVDWLVTQPDYILSDMFGSEAKAASITATDFSNIRTVKPLTLTEFQGKVKYILGD